MNPVRVHSGSGPIVLAFPHGGTFVPGGIAARLNARGQGLDDTDWHISRLYDALLEGATTVQATFHRYVIDANRDPSGTTLYPGQNTTNLCPTTDFDGLTIWQDGQDPSPDDCTDRIISFHAPYHVALRAELDRVKNQHGFAILYDCHSIRSNIPFLFKGELPVFSIGTNGGVTCDAAIETAVTAVCAKAEGFEHVLNGRFKGGWTTRHYGQPHNNIHAIQMELAQRAYMDEAPPWAYRPDRAAALRPYLKSILNDLNIIAQSGALHSYRSDLDV